MNLIRAPKMGWGRQLGEPWCSHSIPFSCCSLYTGHFVLLSLSFPHLWPAALLRRRALPCALARPGEPVGGATELRDLGMPVPEAGQGWRRLGALWCAIRCWLTQCRQLREGPTEQSCHSVHSRLEGMGRRGPLLVTGKAWKGVCGTRGSLRTMHGGGSAPSCCAFTHRVCLLLVLFMG